MVGWGSGGCEPRIEVIVKLKNVGVIRVMGIGPGVGRVNVNQELNLL